MPYKKSKKNIKNVFEVSMMGAAGSMALGSVGGAAAVHGQQGIAGATRFLPVMGTITGTGMLLSSVESFGMKKKKKK